MRNRPGQLNGDITSRQTEWGLGDKRRGRKVLQRARHKKRCEPTLLLRDDVAEVTLPGDCVASGNFELGGFMARTHYYYRLFLFPPPHLAR